MEKVKVSPKDKEKAELGKVLFAVARHFPNLHYDICAMIAHEITYTGNCAIYWGFHGELIALQFFQGDYSYYKEYFYYEENHVGKIGIVHETFDD